MCKGFRKILKVGFLGAIAGALAGLFLAPKSGKETREDLKKRAEEVKEKATMVAEKVGEGAKETAEEIKKTLQEKDNQQP